MIKVTTIARNDLPLYVPRPCEKRDPEANLPATRVHTWLCCSTEEAAWIARCLVRALQIPVFSDVPKGGAS